MDPTSNVENEQESQSQLPEMDEFVIDAFDDEFEEKKEQEDDEEQGQGQEIDGEESKKELIISQRPKMMLKTDKPKYEPSKRYKKFEGNPQDQLNLISEKLLTLEPTKNSTYEMEAKFGTRGIKQITKIDYDNVIKKIKSLGFKCENENGDYSLKIQPEAMYRGELSVAGNFDLFRVEINGLLNIQEYCKTNNIKLINQKSSESIVVLQKYDVKENPTLDEIIHSADFDDFNFRVTLKTERSFHKNNPKVASLFETWNNKKKIFRYINRVTYINHKLFPAFKIDLSIVRSSSKSGGNYGKMMQTTNISDSNVFDNVETYEIEIEVINAQAYDNYIKIKEGQRVFDNGKLTNDLQKIVRYILSGLQETDYPIKYSEQNEVLQNYRKMLFEKEYKEKGENYQQKKVYTSNFIGPSSVALQRINIIPNNSEIIVPNITTPYSYCVTDKADGERHLLYIDISGKIYLINTNMNVVFTGAKTQYEQAFNTLIDGELIKHNKIGNFINKYAAFDIYYFGGTDIRHHPFMYVPTSNILDDKGRAMKYRLNVLQLAIKKIDPMHVNSNKDKSGPIKLSSPISIVSKSFYPSYKESKEELQEYNIFESCKVILNDIKNGIVYDYEVDGLIFTPTTYGVGSNQEKKAGPKKKMTWNYSFKWKPSETSDIFSHSYNTVDFLVKTIKDENNMDIVTPIFESGLNMYESSNMKQFKMLQLCVGYNSRDHGYLNPCNDLLEDNYPKLKDNENDEAVENEYSAKQFYPSDPYDLNAGIGNIMLQLDANNSYQMFTEEGETFTDDMIIEFKYDKYLTKSTSWKWTPLRIRYDKTADYRLTKRNFGNNYNVANSTWYSIHNPITEEMISTGLNIPDVEISDDVYYNGLVGDKVTASMRDFHNLYVKRKLILSVSRKGNNLIDFACGKGGDFPKWNSAKLSFVLGIDISKDNIENKINGACARYLNFKKTDKNTPYALFVNGNSSLNIRSGINMNSEKDNKIIKAVFRIDAKVDNLEPAIERQYGVGYHGFNISSCQFAIHYMFENKTIFYNFLRNVAECTAENGYFIATTYDGKEVFHMLKKLRIGQQVERYIGDKKIWSIQKNYENATFEDNETSLGYQINVYQDSINKIIPEYLVNSEFLIKTMEKYGFSLISNDECRRFKIKHSTGTFRYLYNEFMTEIEDKLDRKMYKDVEKDYGKAYDMTNEEKDISFLNNYFIFKKIVTRDVALLTETLISGISYEDEAVLLDNERIKDTLQDVRNIINKPEPESKGVQEEEEEEEELTFTKKIIQTNANTNTNANRNTNRLQSNKKEKEKENEKEDEEEEEMVFTKSIKPATKLPTSRKLSVKESPPKEKSTKKTSRKSEAKSDKSEAKSDKSEAKSDKTKTKKKRESTIQSVEEMKKKRSES
jgi:hypothetical protein